MNQVEEATKRVTEAVVNEIQQLWENPYAVPVGISARHIHLTKKAVEVLFGKGHSLTFFKKLSQPGQFAANETVALIGPKGTFAKVRVLGPERADCQVELSFSDCRVLGITTPIKASGDIKGTAGVTIKGPAGELVINEGVIIAERHVHMNPQDAKWFHVCNGERVSIRIDGPKAGILENVVVRVSPSYSLDFHIDTDDANAFMVRQGEKCTLIR